MLDELAGHGLRPPLLAADAGYGDNSQFRSALDERGIGCIMQVKGDALAHMPDVRPVERVWSGRGRPPNRTEPRYPKTAVSLVEHVRAAGRGIAETITWRDGSKGTMSSQFVFLRVRPAGHRVARDADGLLPERWLIAGWPDDEAEPVKYWLSSLPATTSHTDLVRYGKIRWRIEHDYRELVSRRHGRRAGEKLQVKEVNAINRCAGSAVPSPSTETLSRNRHPLAVRSVM
ncbi:hypothetical protein B0E53_07026 [Micromonospora sp. MH33]|nr:hypothetical protein B0E53_07026 [Micromonospora sp. MH33]